MNKRQCIFCGSKDLSREHIYSKWIFTILQAKEKVFKPSFHFIERSNANEYADNFSNDVSDGREIRYDDFTLKQVCNACNNGWMSELEVKVKNIFVDLLDNCLDINHISADDALTLSQWVILKTMLASLTTQQKIVFSTMAYRLIQKGIIPEGFIVEVTKMKYSNLNYMIGGPIVRKAFDISREELDFAIMNLYKACLQIGNIAFRVSFLRTEIPVFRKQIIRKLFVLYPYKSKMPFDKQPNEEIDYGEKLELPILSAQLAVHD
ncbi:hypothetical protein [Niastella populi]|uniref:HNH endonuclease 5 domain-containing protein n=1 Tax=Niastella populi TaxID=550983 RepID=A0A1V9G298_9BACT|nr:hypothetical protein [Niastella populi]OQP64628.1 hypothetical protein A4R26_16420 [Niastella populi]